MKKSIAVLMLGSALLLPNNNSVEASYSDNNVQVQKVQYVQHYIWGGQQSHFYNTILGKNIDFEELYKLTKSYALNTEVAVPTPEKQLEKPAPVNPVKKPATAKPVEKPAPTKPAQKPEATPAPAQPAEVAPVKPAGTAQDSSISAIEKAVLDLTNVERQKAGLQPLQTDRNLMNSARQKSADMASKNYFSHTSPTYGSPFDQMKANGVTYKSAAENIAMGQRSAEEVVKGWMESPGHRQNILTPGFTHIGIGYDSNGNYWTQQFIQK
ncbi:CAP domain-containing protein [Sporosarcina sp. JAI121]|uniref:CAP domain-containing protein n=1 Tax=Sporosarcina sp. JAI121 TaxID=2723064 RepID=UPI0015C70025|nr:CAP domain-containing protein [Sporosarcina sp. JAI121]NYF24724.1 putative YkwD family protein [Sporosarcina sp. JAI121]